MTSNIQKQLKGFTRALTVSAGFTLVETLVAVLLLTTAIAGPLTIASKSLLAAVVAKDQIAAFFLAQDAMEYVRFARDTNKLRNTHWLNGSGSGATSLTSCRSATGCRLDTGLGNPTVPTACSAAQCGSPVTSSSLSLYENNGRYWYSTTAGNIRTPFVRQITITDVSATEAAVEVTVRWRDATRERSVTVRENIFDWQ